MVKIRRNYIESKLKSAYKKELNPTYRCLLWVKNTRPLDTGPHKSNQG